MSDEDDMFTGEYDYNLKCPFKIPRRTFEPVAPGSGGALHTNDEMHSPLAILPPTISQSFSPFGQAPPLPPPPPPPTTPPPTPPLPPLPNEKLPTRKRPYAMARHEGLPDELTKLMQPLNCLLCSVKLNSIITANIHYESKTHEKKITAWLNEWSARTGEPLPKRLPQRNTPTGPNAMHCDICDLALTSVQHAKQHYQGKKHRQVLEGRGKPSGSGYYDGNNKWIRVDTKVREDLANRFFIGTSFVVKPKEDRSISDESETFSEMPPTPNINDLYDDDNNSAWNVNADDDCTHAATDLPTAINATKSNATSTTSPSAKEPTIDEYNVAIRKAQIEKIPGRYCEICDISVTSEVHMKLHLNGAKHAKKLRQLDAPPYAPINDTISQCLMANGGNGNMAEPKTNDGSIDFSVYRTPSGQYYCQVCNLTVSSEIMMKQHFGSKKHVKKIKKP